MKIDTYGQHCLDEVAGWYGTENTSMWTHVACELDFSNLVGTVTGPVTITFSSPEVVAGDWIYIIQEFEDGTTTMEKASYVGDGVVQAQFDVQSGKQFVIIEEISLARGNFDYDIADLADAVSTINGVAGATDAQGNAIEVSVNELDGDRTAVAVDTSRYSLDVDGVIAAAELNVASGAVYPVTVTFQVNGVTASDAIKVLCLNPQAYTWDALDAVAGDGTVTVTCPAGVAVAIVRTGVGGSTSTGGDTAALNGLQPAADGNWYKYVDGVVDTSYTGIYCDANAGCWLVIDGRVALDYTGIWVDPNYGCWLIGGGAVAFDYTGIWADPNYGCWLIGGGAVAFDYTGVWNDPNYGAWYIQGGAVGSGYTE